MDDSEIRRDALRMAMDTRPPNERDVDTVKRAEAFYRFMQSRPLNGKPEGSPPGTRGIVPRPERPPTVTIREGWAKPMPPPPPPPQMGRIPR